MIEIKKIMTGVFKAYVNGIDTPYSIRLANGFGGGSGKVFYDVYKGTERLNQPMIRLSLHSAKQKVMAEILKNS
jgi:hypothetical protein